MRKRFLVHAALVVTVAGWGAMDLAMSQLLDEEAERKEVAKIIGPEGYTNSCADCHAKEHAAWKETTHQKAFDTRYQDEKAEGILGKLDLESMEEGLCRQCHYTSKLEDDDIFGEWGVSCESCHSGARDWVEIHQLTNGSSGAGAVKWGTGHKDQKERKTRIEKAQSSGMIHSDMTYEIAMNCFGCHIAADERLVNVGGHPPGSPEFELSPGRRARCATTTPALPGLRKTRPTCRPRPSDGRGCT